MVSISIAIRNGMALLADASIRALLLAGCAALILTLSRTIRGNVLHAVWSTIVLAMLLMPFATAFLPPVPLRVLQPKRHSPPPPNRPFTTPWTVPGRWEFLPARFLAHTRSLFGSSTEYF